MMFTSSVCDPRAFTRSDLLVILVISGVGLAMLSPALLAARGDARKSECVDKVRALTAACLEFESIQGFIPASTSRMPAKRGFMGWILPHLDQSLADAYNYDVDWHDPKNTKVISTELPVFYCPDAPQISHLSSGQAGDRVWTGACMDYGMVSSLDQSTAKSQGVPSAQKNMRCFVTKKTELAEVTDGLANTLLFVERAGFPNIWVRGKQVDPAVIGMTRDETAKHSVWATPRIAIGVRGHTFDGLTMPGPYAVNRCNYKGAYSFHPGFVNLGMGDGSVRVLNEGVDLYVFYALCTIQGEEAVPTSDPYGARELPEPEQAIPVRGKILVDGEPAAGAVVCFHPRNDPSSHAKRTYGDVGRDGSYSLTTNFAEDGAPAGDYIVTVYWSHPQLEPRVGWDASILRPDLLRGRFATREYSPLRATVGNSETEFAPVDLNSEEITESAEFTFPTTGESPSP